jgi:hypothetical protein
MLGNSEHAKNLNGEALRREPTDSMILDQKKRVRSRKKQDKKILHEIIIYLS